MRITTPRMELHGGGAGMEGAPVLASTSMGAQPDPDAITADLEVSDRELLLRLTGPNASHLRAFEKEYGVSAGIRGNTILLRGRPDAIAEAERGLAEVLSVLERGKH